MSVTRLYIVRHGQTEWNVQRRLQGHADSPLTERGLRQADWLADALSEETLDVIYSSPSQRTMRTAERIAGSRPLPILQSGALRELSLGIWEGRTQEELYAQEAASFRLFWEDPHQFRVEGGETYAQVQDRVLAELGRISTEHRGQSVLLVTHTVVVKLLMSHFENRPLQRIWEPPYIHPACLCRVDLHDAHAEIILHGDISHYQEPAEED